MNKPLISIVSPVYKAELVIDTLVERLRKSLKAISENYEIILVEDNSPDNSWQKIKIHSGEDQRIKGIRLSRNFGQHYAITAGLDHCKGEWVVVMDCDLQDQPEEILRLYQMAISGYDIVLAKREKRQDHFFKRYSSKAFYGVLGYLTGSKQDSAIANFGIYHRKVIHCISQMRESIRYFPTMIKWVGFNSTEIEVEHAPRLVGKTSYNLSKLFNLALDIILAYSDKPIRLLVKLGFSISFISFIFAVYTIIKAIRGQIVILGYASIIISIWLLSGFIIFTLGIIGLYIGKTFEGVKNRPIYIIRERTWE